MRFKKYIFCYDIYNVSSDMVETHRVSIYAKSLKEAKSKLEILGYRNLYQKKKRKLSY